MAEIVNNSNLKSMEYVPYALSWMVHLQAIVFTPYTSFHESVFTVKYFREIFILSDGENIALDWFEEPKPQGKKLKKEKRPLLVCIGGLGGGQQATYMKPVMHKARKMGYQIVYLHFRATGDMPVTTDKIHCMLSWQDIKEPSDYLFQKYCKNQGRSMYLYGVSLGATMQTHYLINDD